MMEPTYQKTLCSRFIAHNKTLAKASAEVTKSGSLDASVLAVRGRWTLLIVLLSVWGAVGMWVLSEWPETQHVPLTHVSGQKAKADAVRPKTAPGASGSDLKIHLELLAASRERTEKSFTTPKNIFTSVLAQQISVPTPTPVPAPVATSVPIIPQPSAEELAQEASRRELGHFRFFGYLRRDGKEEAFLSKGNVLHITAMGQTIEQKFLVKTVTPAGVTLQDTASNIELVVSLAGEGTKATGAVASTFTSGPPAFHAASPGPVQPVMIPAAQTVIASHPPAATASSLTVVTAPSLTSLTAGSRSPVTVPPLPSIIVPPKPPGTAPPLPSLMGARPQIDTPAPPSLPKTSM